MLLLAIETSSSRGGIAILEDGRLLADAPFPEGLVHGREITVHLEALMKGLDLTPGRLGAIAVGLGPGSYTGIRVGVTAAKTLAFALRIPVLTQSSLHVIAANLMERASGPEGLRVAVAIDGKQRHFYLARFRLLAGGSCGRPGDEVVQETPDRVVALPRPVPGKEALRIPLAIPSGAPGWKAREELLGVLSGADLIVGDAADQALAEVEGIAGRDAPARGPCGSDWPRAATLGALAARSLAQGLPAYEPEGVHGLVPIYLRPSGAEQKFAGKR